MCNTWYNGGGQLTTTTFTAPDAGSTRFAPNLIHFERQRKE